MTTSLEKVGLKSPVVITNDVSVTEKPVAAKQENVSELLAGNNIQDENKILNMPQKENKNFYDTLSWALSIGIFIFALSNPGRRLISNFTYNFQKRHNIKRLQNVWKSRANFTEIPFSKSSNINELKTMAKKLGVKIKISDFNGEEDIAKFNTILSVLTDAHNKSKGRILLPKRVTLERICDASSGETNRLGFMRLDKRQLGTDLEHTVCHELGHINHYYRTNPDRMNLYAAIVFGADKTTVKEFSKNIALQDDIINHISFYAATNPSEFIAETFAHIMGGGSVPKHLMQRYAQYKGMPRIPVIRNFAEKQSGSLIFGKKIQ